MYPNATQMIEQFHSLGVRVILWVTSMINTDSPNYQYGLDNNYYLNKGRTIKWWLGEGSFLDYTNPNACIDPRWGLLVPCCRTESKSQCLQRGALQ